MTSPRAVVFLGPTLTVAEASGVLDADFLPPVELGDVWRIAQEEPAAIGVVDGYFHRVPSVWHKELLFAMSRGIPVYGSASMGALRAAELAQHGMIGIGDIAAGYRTGLLSDDDEVAVVHAPAELGFEPLSEPLVNVRATLDAAVADGVLSQGGSGDVLAAARRIFYADRAWPQIIEAADLSPDERRSLELWLPGGRVDRKRLDALEMLRRMRDDASGESALPDRTVNPFAETVLWREFVQRETPVQEILDEFRLRSPLRREVGEAIDRATRGERFPWRDLLSTLPEWPALCRRARIKARVAGTGGADPPVGFSEAELVHWFFGTRLGWPDDLAAFLKTRGWINEAVICRAAAREAVFLAARTGDPMDDLAPRWN